MNKFYPFVLHIYIIYFTLARSMTPHQTCMVFTLNPGSDSSPAYPAPPCKRMVLFVILYLAMSITDENCHIVASPSLRVQTSG